MAGDRPPARLTDRPLGSLADALAVRRLRNSCAASLTNHRRPIGRWSQVIWYLRRYRPRRASGEYRVLLFRNGHEAVGYGALQLRRSELLITECVAPEQRGQGVGRAILERLVEVAGGEGRDVVAEIWSDNRPSIALHESAGFVHENTVDHDGGRLRIYRLTPPVSLP